MKPRRKPRPFQLVLLPIILNITIINICCTIVSSQQSPNPLYSTKQFNESAMFRQTLCERQSLIADGKLSLRSGLQGIALRALITPNQFFQLNSTTGAIDEEHPGLMVSLMDEIALRGNFTWRDSYAVTDPRPMEGKSWEDLLDWAIDTYDISVDWWTHATTRMARGVGFPEGWYDGSIIMVGDVSNESGLKMFTWLRPFHAEVWFMIAGTIVISGLVYWLLETIDRRTDDDPYESSPIEDIFRAGVGFTNQFEFQPNTNAGRLFAFSLSFWAMLTTAAYTANFANFLVAQNQPKLQVDSLSHAIRQNFRICVHKKSAEYQIATNSYKIANYILFEGPTWKEDLYRALNHGECEIALTTVSAWLFNQRDIEINGACNLDWVGRGFQSIMGGFATKLDSGIKCTSLIRDVFNLHLLEMKEQGIIEQEWNAFLQKQQTVDCNSGNEPTLAEENDTTLDLESMQGMFVLHFVLCFLSLCIAVWYRCNGWHIIPRFEKKGPRSRGAIREKLEEELVAEERNAESDAADISEETLIRRSILRQASRRTLSEIVEGIGDKIVQRASSSNDLRKSGFKTSVELETIYDDINEDESESHHSSLQSILARQDQQMNIISAQTNTITEMKFQMNEMNKQMELMSNILKDKKH